MGMNGRIGRAKTLAKIRRDLLARAKAAGVDVTDRKAVREFDAAEFRAVCERIAKKSAESGQCP